MVSLKDLKTHLASALICLALTSSPVISFADDSQVWSDPKTGLDWSKCPVGKHYGPDPRNEIGCVSDGESKYNWWAAVVAADQSELAGFSDWRMPTFEELKTLLSCDYAPDSMFLPLLHDKARMNSPEAKDLIPGCVMNEHAAINFNKVVGTESPWTATIYVDMFSKVADPNKVRLWDNQSWNTKWFPSGNKTDKNEVALVRGGTPSEIYPAILAEAQKESAKLQAEEKATKEADIARMNAAREASKQRDAAIEAKSRAYWAAYEAKKVQLRKNPKVGDKVKGGMIIATKGDIVQIQSYQNVCLNYASNGACLRNEMQSAGTQWVNRNDLLPPP